MSVLLAACSGGGSPSGTSAAVADAKSAPERPADAAPSSVVRINLSGVYNIVGIANAGSPVPEGGLDGLGYAYAAALLGSSTFTMGPAEKADAVSAITIPLPGGNDSALSMLATGIRGNQPSQPFIINYTDGTSDRISQSLSDWHTPQAYSGESIAATFAYRINAGGGVDENTFRLYSYTLPLDDTKTVESLTLPANRHVVVLALNEVPVGPPPAPSPAFSPAPGTYASTQTVTLSDSIAGASIYYTTDGTTPTTSSALYRNPLTVSVSTTLSAIAAASGYANSAINTGAYTIAPPSAGIDVDLSSAANAIGLANSGTPVPAAGLDGKGYAYAAALLTGAVNWSGTTFKLGGADKLDATSTGVITLPVGKDMAFKLLATAVNGNQATQPFLVTYTDGTTARFTQSLSDWNTPQHYAGESTAATMAYRITSTGGIDARTFDLYGYSFPLDAGKTVKSLTLPDNRDIVVLAIALVPASAATACDPLTYGAIGDGVTDNTAPIQSAIDACAVLGGGVVPLTVVGSDAVYLTGPFTLKSNIQLDIGAGVTLQGTNDHSRYVGAYINWVYQPNEALISATGASQVAIVGSGIIDGAGGRLQPNGGPSWWTMAAGSSTSVRPWMIEFYRCDHVTITGVTLRNSPMWHQALRFSQVIVESGVTVAAPPDSPNTDGVDVVGSTEVTLSHLNIAVGDDNIALKSGLPIDPTDPKQQGIPQLATSQVQISNITAGSGHGISIGSEASNGVNNVSIQDVNFTDTGNGFRLKTARGRGSQIYAITLNNLVMTDVALPLSINDYYPGLGGPVEPPYQAAQPITATTPFVHDITIQNLMATGATQQSFIEGLPESCVQNVSLSGVSIHTKSAGLALRHMTGTFANVTSVPAASSPFIVQENVSVTTTGTTPTIVSTPPQAGQIACSAQVMPLP